MGYSKPDNIEIIGHAGVCIFCHCLIHCCSLFLGSSLHRLTLVAWDKKKVSKKNGSHILPNCIPETRAQQHPPNLPLHLTSPAIPHRNNTLQDPTKPPPTSNLFCHTALNMNMLRLTALFSNTFRPTSARLYIGHGLLYVSWSLSVGMSAADLHSFLLFAT